MNELKMYIIIAIIGVVVIVNIYKFAKKSKEQKISSVKEWLKWAVVTAEKELGSKTGRLKLQSVYNLALVQFPWLAKLVSFETFCGWVDEALKWMDGNLNETEKKYIDK